MSFRKIVGRTVAVAVLAALGLAGCSSTTPAAPSSDSTGGGSATQPAASSTTAGSGTASGSGQPAADADPQCGKQTRTIKHEFGETTISGKPSRVVVLEFSFADALGAIGISPVGVADDGDSSRLIPQVRQEIGDYTSVGNRQSPSLQNIAALRPDLIIADSSRHKAIYDQLSKMAPTIALPANRATIAMNLDAARTIGVAVDECQKMTVRLQQNKSRLEAAAAKLPKDLPPVLFAVGSDKALTVHNLAGYVPSLLAELGLKYLLPADPANPQAEESEETLATQNPGVMFVASSKKAPTIFDSWAKDPVGSSIAAVKDGKVFRVSADTWSRAKGITASEVVADEVVALLTGK